jgi:thiol-disulfide isomerase/thioredoxin
MSKFAVSIGALALPTSLVVLLTCGLAAAAVGYLAGRRRRINIASSLLDMLLAGAIAARIAFVLLWFDQYCSAPWSALDIRDGGFTSWAGILAASLVALWNGWRHPPLRKPLALRLVAGAMGWLAAPGALRFGADPTLQDLNAISLFTPQGTVASLAALARGKPMVVNLWASWCPPCRREMPVLATAQQQLTDVSFVFANEGEDVFTLQQYLEAGKLELGNVVLDPRKGLGQKYGSMALPTTLFYDATGRLVDTHLGALSAASLASKLEKLQVRNVVKPKACSH